MHAQIFSADLMTCSFWNSDFLCYFTNSQMMSGTNHIPNFMFSSFFDVEGRPERSLSSTEVWPSLKHLYQSGVVLYSWCHLQTLVLMFQKSLKTSSQIWNKISHKHVAHENHLFIIAEKFTEQARHVHSNRHSTLTKKTRMIQFVAFTAVQCNQWTSLHLHFGALIQKFGNFTEWLRMLEEGRLGQ